MKRIFLSLLFLFIMSCATSSVENRTSEIKIPESVKSPPIDEAAAPEPDLPEFIPVKEESSPLQTKVVSIAARNTPLRDVLYTIAEAAHLNLVMERDVDPELPVTMTFNNLNIEDALNIIFDSVDYFYTIKENILLAQAKGTEIFELGQPNVIHEYKTDVGGDILSGTSSGGEGTSAVSGDVGMTSSSDSNSFQFWDAMENTLTRLLSSDAPGQEDGTPSRFVINRMTGTIMITASKKDLKKAGNYINNLKRVLNRQVLVEARIIEVQLSEGLKYGIDWNAVGRWLTEDSISISANSFTSIFASGGASFDINILDADDLTFLLKALQEQGDVKTLSNPRLNIMNGQTSLLSVGRNTTFISKVETTTTTDGATPVTTFTVSTNSVLSGVMFGLVPYINSKQEITMAITPIVTNLVDLESKTIGSADNSVEIKLPTVDLREMSTTVKVLDGQLIIIGGLIDKKEILKENKIPFLGNIPFIGAAFKSVEKSYENTELVILLIPRIVS